MLTPLNKITRVLHDTLFMRAEGDSFTLVTSLFGMRRPLVINQEQWRAACRSTIYAAKGTPGPLFKFLEHTFGEWIAVCSTFSGTALSRNVIEFDEAIPALQNRYVRINGKLYRSSAFESGTARLSFHLASSSLFSAPDFTSLQSYSCAFLPFDIIENNCEYRVLLDDGILELPPTYLREDGEAREDDPLGGHLMDYTSSVETERFGDPLGVGPFPAYLGDDDFTNVFGEAFRNLLCAGIYGRILDFKWINGAASIYGSIYNRRVYGSVSPSPPDLVTPTRG